jgi:PD-(D/E)XK nuclease superfamily
MQTNKLFPGSGSIRAPPPQGFRRSYLPISSVSLLGECETRYADSIFGRLYPTAAMKMGAARHAELAHAMPKAGKDKILGSIRAGSAFEVREIAVADEQHKLKGRLDQLNLTGHEVNGKGEAIVVDDKYTRTRYDSIPPHYGLQLAAYALAIDNSKDFGGICEVTGAKLVCRNRLDHFINQEFIVGQEELRTWKASVPLAAKVAWVIYRKEREPGHRRLDIGTGEWVRCGCGVQS